MFTSLRLRLGGHAAALISAASVLSLCFLSGCEVRSSAIAESSREASGQPPREVQTVVAVEEQVTRAIGATGTLEPQDQLALAIKVSGRIQSLTVDLGDAVRKEQILAKLEPTDFRIQAEQAAAALQQARTRLGLLPDGPEERVDPEQTSTVRQAKAMLNETRLKRDRAQQLFDDSLVARSDLDTAIASHAVAEGAYENSIEEIRNRVALLAQRKSELDLARHQLDQTVLRSPIDGAVATRHASAGEFVPAGTPVVTIVRVHPLRLHLPVPERASSDVYVGQQVKLKVERDLHQYYGRVTRLSPAIDQANRTLLVEAEVPNEQGRLRPGAFVRAELVAKAGSPAVFVPAKALVTFAGIEKVFVVEQGKSVEKAVRTGRKDVEKVEITAGIKPGDVVVTDPGNLVAGQPVISTN
ncbi:MAG: efflux RND transporter periplasmic adaptor subunit [Bryobacterales bacterium]